MPFSRRLFLFAIGIFLGVVASYFILGDRLFNGSWTPTARIKMRLNATLVKATPWAQDQMRRWPTDLAAVKASIDSAEVKVQLTRRVADSIFYILDTRVAGRPARINIGVIEDYRKDSTATLRQIDLIE